MPRLITLVLWFITAILCGSILVANNQPTAQSLNKMPLAFTKNMGQWDDRVLFRANSGGATMWFTKDGITYQFTRHIDGGTLDERRGTLHVPAGTRSVPLQEGLDSRLRGNDKGSGNDIEPDSIEQLVLTAKFVGANPNPEIIAEGEMEYKCNYFLGNDPSKWHTDVPNYEAITIKDIYPGIDLKYSGDGQPQAGQAAYEFIVAPGANIAQVKIKYEGAEEALVDGEGRVVLKTRWGNLTAGIGSDMTKVGLSSLGLQEEEEDNTFRIAASGQSLEQSGSSTFRLVYSTYFGGSGDFISAIAVDSGGCAYVTGCTGSSDFPTLNPFQPQLVYPYDAFVTKFSGTGNSLIYSTYLGGGGIDYWVDDWAWAIAVSRDGKAWVTGTTNSRTFPICNAFQDHHHATYDVFVTELASGGNSLIFSTFLGGNVYQSGMGITVDDFGNGYVAGINASQDFPTLNPFQTGEGGFVSKFSSSGTMIYSTCLNRCAIYEIAVDVSGNAYLTGGAGSGLATLNPIQTYQGGGDAFVAKLSNSGSTLMYSTFLGGVGQDFGSSIAVDKDGSAYVQGITVSANFPTLNPFQLQQGGRDAFVSKLNPAGSALVYSTYLGGSGREGYIVDIAEYPNGSIAVDHKGRAWVASTTSSIDFPPLNPIQEYQGGFDAFVVRLNPTGDGIDFGTYLGGGSVDEAYGVAIDRHGSVYIAGPTSSSDFPTVNPFQSSNCSGCTRGYVAKFGRADIDTCGDVNVDGRVDLRDLVFLRNHVIFGGPAPQSLSFADVDCSGSIDIADVIILANYFFRSGPVPCAAC